MDKNILLKCENVSFGYETGAVIKNFNLTVNKGDYIAIMGENGVGKTTFIRSILGLIKPLSGIVEIADNIHIGYLPQQTQAQKDFPSSVFEIVLSGFSSKLFYTKKEKQIAIEKLKMLNILNLKKKYYRELSGGQQQKVLLARALCATNDLIVLDEPTTGLDPNASADFYKLIKNLNKNEKITVLMVSHDVENALKEAEKILYIKNDGCFFTDANDFNAKRW